MYCTIISVMYHEYMPIPRNKELSRYVLQAVHELGGSAPISAVEHKVAELLGLTSEERAEIRTGAITKLSHHVAWARFSLKKQGLLASAKRGFSVLSEKGKELFEI